MLQSLAEGWRFAAAFNPVFSLVGAAATAALMARRPGVSRRVAAVGVLACAWLLGDGMRVIGQARAAYDGLAPASPIAGWAMLAVWGTASLAIGYAAPAWAGTFAGRRVTIGTGWISAAVVAASVSTALSAIARSM